MRKFLDMLPRINLRLAAAAFCAVAILHIGRMHDRVQQEALRVGRDVALDALDFLGRIETDRINPHPPFSALLTLWLSMMAAEGSALRCSLSRIIFSSTA